MPCLVTAIDQATPDWLTGVLRRSGALPAGAMRSVTVTRVHTEQLNSLGYFLRVDYTAGAPATAPARLFLKLPRPGADPAVVARIGTREVRLYQALRHDQHALPVIPCYDARYDAGQGAYHLLLADLSATHDQPVDYRTIADHYIEQTVDSLARLHAYWWEHPQLGDGIGDRPDPAVLREECAQLQAAYPAFADHLGDRLTPEDRRIYERVLAALPALRARRLLLSGRTLVHGDAHFWNFLYPRDPRTGHTCIIDWQTYRLGRGPDDLAYTVVLRFPHRTPHNEQHLVRRYHAGLLAHGVADYDWSACWEDYQRAAAEYVLASLRWWRHGLPEGFWALFVSPPLRAFRELASGAVLG